MSILCCNYLCVVVVKKMSPNSSTFKSSRNHDFASVDPQKLLTIYSKFTNYKIVSVPSCTLATITPQWYSIHRVLQMLLCLSHWKYIDCLACSLSTSRCQIRSTPVTGYPETALPFNTPFDRTIWQATNPRNFIGTADYHRRTKNKIQRVEVRANDKKKNFLTSKTYGTESPISCKSKESFNAISLT